MGARCDTSSSGIGITLLHASQVDGILGLSVAGLKGTIAIAIPGTGRYKYRIWLSDSATDPTRTVNLPSSNIVEWEGFTDANGEASIVVENTDAEKSWYVWAVFDILNVSAVLTVGT